MSREDRWERGWKGDRKEEERKGRENRIVCIRETAILVKKIKK